MLVLYTDGVTEVRRRRARGVRPPRAGGAAGDAAAGCRRTRWPSASRRPCMAASEGRLRDDMAILAFGPTPQPKETDG